MCLHLYISSSTSDILTFGITLHHVTVRYTTCLAWVFCSVFVRLICCNDAAEQWKPEYDPHHLPLYLCRATAVRHARCDKTQLAGCLTGHMVVGEGMFSGGTRSSEDVVPVSTPYACLSSAVPAVLALGMIMVASSCF